MRRLSTLIALLLLASATAAAEEFVAGTEDVPMMPGLTFVTGSDLVFDKPEGRIVEAQAQGAVARAKVHAFYAASLPPLGWKKIGVDHWQRDAERLKLDFRGPDGHLIVSFTISPQ